MRTTEELDGYLLDIPQEKVCFIYHVHLCNTICTWHRAGFDMSYRFVSRMELARCPSKMTHRNIQVDSWAGALPAAAFCPWSEQWVGIPLRKRAAGLALASAHAPRHLSLPFHTGVTRRL